MNLLKDPWFWVHTLGPYAFCTIFQRLGICWWLSGSFSLLLVVGWEYFVDHKRWIFKSLADPKGPDIMDVAGGCSGIGIGLLIWN
jgi:hypothetical protein